jgi:hypothetical protein
MDRHGSSVRRHWFPVMTIIATGLVLIMQNASMKLQSYFLVQIGMQTKASELLPTTVRNPELREDRWTVLQGLYCFCRRHLALTDRVANHFFAISRLLSPSVDTARRGTFSTHFSYSLCISRYAVAVTGCVPSVSNHGVVTFFCRNIVIIVLVQAVSCTPIWQDRLSKSRPSCEDPSISSHSRLHFRYA